MRSQNYRTFELPKISSPDGSLTFLESLHHIPFDIKRIYYLYDIPGGGRRGSHAHKNLHQVFVAIAGSFDITLDNGEKKNVIHMNRPFIGLYVGPMMWRTLDNFSSGSVCLVLASEKYEESDYYRNYNDFKEAIANT